MGWKNVLDPKNSLFYGMIPWYCGFLFSLVLNIVAISWSFQDDSWNYLNLNPTPLSISIAIVVFGAFGILVIIVFRILGFHDYQKRALQFIILDGIIMFSLSIGVVVILTPSRQEEISHQFLLNIQSSQLPSSLAKRLQKANCTNVSFCTNTCKEHIQYISSFPYYSNISVITLFILGGIIELIFYSINRRQKSNIASPPEQFAV